MKAIVGVLVTVGAVMAALALSGGPEVAKAAAVSFSVQAAGGNAIPAVIGGGAANAQFVFDDETNELTYVVAVQGTAQDDVTGADLNRGVAGEEGPVAYTLADEGFVQIAGSVELSDEDVNALLAGELYLNVHSIDHPEGFARGQLVPPEGIISADDDADAAPEADPGEAVEGAGDIAPPNTGDGGLADSGGAALPMAAALAAVLAGSGVLVLTLRRA
jgi:hypothetical protein